MYSSAFQSLRLLRNSSTANFRQRLSSSQRCQFRGYSQSTGYGNKGVKDPDIMPETQSTSHSNPFLKFGVPAALLGAAVGLATFVRKNDERRAINKGEGRKDVFPVNGPRIGGPFTLINTKREIVTEKNLAGNWVLLYFGYTSSPDVGPAEVQKLAKAIDILESPQKVKLLPIFVTIDPQRDSPSQLDAYLKDMLETLTASPSSRTAEFDSRIVGLTGPVNSVRLIAQEYRVFFKRVEEDADDYLVESSHNMYLINPNMEIVRCFGTEYGAEELSEAIAKELKRNVH